MRFFVSDLFSRPLPSPVFRLGRSRRLPLTALLAGLVGLGLLASSGCRPQEAISTYTVPKDETPAGETQRMLAAMVPHESQAWFFKVTGPDTAVRSAGPAFRDFIRSVRFEGQQPRWDVPAGWSEQGGSQMRYATIRIPAEGGALELTVIPLPMADGDTPDYRLANVNRWRGQLSLPPISEGELENTTEQVELAGGSATLVELVGQSSGGGGPPFAAMAPMSETPPIVREGPQEEPPTEPAGGLAYDAPAEWNPGRVGGLRKAAFTVADGDRNVEITVIDLAAAASDLTSNVNRWRGQVGLPALSAEEISEQARSITVGGQPGQYVELVGPAETESPQTILGAIVIHGERGWFFKLMGDSQLAEREQERFRQFLETVQFE